MEDKKAAKKIIKRAKKHPDWYTAEDVRFAKLVKKRIKAEKKLRKEETQDFWNSEDLERVWSEMESMEPLTPVTKTERES